MTVALTMELFAASNFWLASAKAAVMMAALSIKSRAQTLD